MVTITEGMSGCRTVLKFLMETGEFKQGRMNSRDDVPELRDGSAIKVCG